MWRLRTRTGDVVPCLCHRDATGRGPAAPQLRDSRGGGTGFTGTLGLSLRFGINTAF